VLRSSPAVVLAVLFASLAPSQTPPGPELLPAERQALTEFANGQPRSAARSLLATANDSAADAAADADVKARVEAWATFAVELASGAGDREFTAELLTLLDSPLAKAAPLLRDRLRVLALEAQATLPDTDLAALATAAGCLRQFWLVGPFANERGDGFARALGPEGAFDLEAEFAGKRRTVRWRQLPALDQRVSLPLHLLATPHTQSLVYLATAIVAERNGTAVLELGSTGSVRVFVNGAEVFARAVERPFRFDQDAVALPLVAGANLLVLKVCHQEGDDFRALFRLRNIDGSQASWARASAAAADLQAAAGTKPPAEPAAAAEAAAMPLGGRSHWAIDTVRGADALRLSWLWRARRADGDRDRRDAAAAKAARTELPNEAAAWLETAWTLERHQRSGADRDENERRRAFERVLALAPGHVEAQVQLGELLQQSSRLWRAARTHAEAALRRAPDHPRALWLMAQTLRDEGLEEVADAELVLAARRPTAAAATLTRGADAAQKDAPALALSLRHLYRQFLTWDGDVPPLASLLLRTGQRPAAAELLATAIARDPFALRPRRQLAELQLATGDPARAVAVLEPWFAINPDDAESWILLARSYRQLGTDTAAAQQRRALQQALAIEPNRRDDERYLDFLTSTSGDAAASDSEASAFYAAYRVDAQTHLATADAPDAAEANDPLHWLFRQAVVRANGNGTTNTYVHEVVRVRTTDGARWLSTFRLPFWAGEQSARVLACTIHRADGSVQRPAAQGPRVRLPDLRPGDVVAIEGRIDDLQPTFFGDYFGYEHRFLGSDGSPVALHELVVIADKGRDYRVQTVNGAPAPEHRTLADGSLEWRCRMTGVERDRPEPWRPDAKEFAPMVRFTTYRDWQQFATWWWHLIEKQLEVTPAMRATVQRLTAGLDGIDAKIAAIYHFVTTDVRYEAWEFGVHGYKPYSTAVIHERRHGDCKDKALLLTALLGEIGVPCHPVLIFADDSRSRDDLDLPLVQHFNHCIAWLPPHGGRDGRFLDGTATWHPTSTLPAMDQGARVLVVKRGEAELRDVPWTDPERHRDRIATRIELRADGGAGVEVEDRPLGNAAVALRQMLATEPARRREQIERWLLRTFGKATLQQLTAEPAAPEADVALRASADLAAIGQRDGGRWQLPSRFGDDELLQLVALDSRKAPLLLGPPRGEAATLRYRLPPGYRPGALPAAVALDAPFGSFRMRWQPEGDSITVERTLALSTARIEAADYAAFREFVTAVKAADGQLVLLQQEAR
jgi:cellulose synthase operon protein C